MKQQRMMLIIRKFHHFTEHNDMVATFILMGHFALKTGAVMRQIGVPNKPSVHSSRQNDQRRWWQSDWIILADLALKYELQRLLQL